MRKIRKDLRNVFECSAIRAAVQARKSSSGGCATPVDLTQQSVPNLNIENLFTPPSVEENSIGFELLLEYTASDYPAGDPRQICRAARPLAL
jgi:hypothetical protein